MERYDYVIIGSGIAGVSAAEAIREHDHTGTIAIISDEPHILYSRVLLPSLLKKKIARERVFLRTRDAFEKKRIALLLGEKALSVNADAYEVALASGLRLRWRKLLVATGGKPRHWGGAENQLLSGQLQKHGYRLQTIDDADRLAADLPRLREPAVIGSSFIALEFLDIFVTRGLRPRLICRGPHLFSSILDEDGGALLAHGFALRGVICHFDDSITHIAEQENALVVETAKRASFRADALAMGIGIERAVGFLDGSGIILGKTGVLTNEFLETNIPGAYAAGDVAETYDPARNTHYARGNWTNAALQGAAAGMNMAGRRTAFTAVPSYSIMALGMRIAVIGACDGASDIITRTDAAHLRYGRFFIRDGALAGAALINYSDLRPYLTEMIAHKTPVDGYRRMLTDPTFDIRTVPLIISQETGNS